jgi:hypothetical protein
MYMHEVGQPCPKCVVFNIIKQLPWNWCLLINYCINNFYCCFYLLQKKTQRDLTYLKGKYTSKHPLYVINGTVIKGKDLNATAKFFINLDEKLLQGNINYTPGIVKCLSQIFNHIFAVASIFSLLSILFYFHSLSSLFLLHFIILTWFCW